MYYTQLKQNKFKFTFDGYILYQMGLKNGGRHMSVQIWITWNKYLVKILSGSVLNE
jgi:hypothetical protein